MIPMMCRDTCEAFNARELKFPWWDIIPIWKIRSELSKWYQRNYLIRVLKLYIFNSNRIHLLSSLQTQRTKKETTLTEAREIESYRNLGVENEAEASEWDHRGPNSTVSLKMCVIIYKYEPKIEIKET